MRRRKISGILCEIAGEHLHIGVGLNCGQQDFSPDRLDSATSISIETGQTCGPLEILPSFLPYWHETITELSAAELPEAAEVCLCDLGREVEICEGDPRRGIMVRGTVEGVGPAGELRLKQKSGRIRSIYSGE